METNTISLTPSPWWVYLAVAAMFVGCLVRVFFVNRMKHFGTILFGVGSLMCVLGICFKDTKVYTFRDKISAVPPTSLHQVETGLYKLLGVSEVEHRIIGFLEPELAGQPSFFCDLGHISKTAIRCEKFPAPTLVSNGVIIFIPKPQ